MTDVERGGEVGVALIRGGMAGAAKHNPLFRIYKVVWWIVAIWLATAVLIGVIRGTFVTGPAPEPLQHTVAPEAPLPPR